MDNRRRRWENARESYEVSGGLLADDRTDRSSKPEIFLVPGPFICDVVGSLMRRS